ncbi:hypothetical protein PPYR_08270 [Photinus pyralis]|uniref:Uncharacterized protein n=1 Tax=Photinus pyralis TaxID=7054 RepID=A0A5N4AJ14_PHOPY|nr:hypothetical protein PPYR_08270 [Photinus pyralis]
MELFEEKTYFKTLRSIPAFTGFNLEEKLNMKQKVCLWLVPMMTCVYAGFVLLKEWKLTDDINDFLYTSVLAIAWQRVFIMRIQRSRLAKLLILLEKFPMDDKEVKSHLNAILTKVVTIFVTLPPIAVVSGVVAWYTTYGEGTLPFGSMASWAMEYTTNMCLVIQVMTYTFLGHEFLMWDGTK